ncbi:unnamed protein product [Orchesella dallaii]|uniref:Uncharacterized protein n=1 Tax=Orchesella dallaii TaxID=48710 RepID=A0ABP1RWZ2_9HEXA
MSNNPASCPDRNCLDENTGEEGNQKLPSEDDDLEHEEQVHTTNEKGENAPPTAATSPKVWVRMGVDEDYFEMDLNEFEEILKVEQPKETQSLLHTSFSSQSSSHDHP